MEGISCTVEVEPQHILIKYNYKHNRNFNVITIHTKILHFI
jgi:hypothetical protein